MNFSYLKSLLALSFAVYFFNASFGQNINPSDTSLPVIPKQLTIVYDISIKTNSHKAGIEETYNGGIKTLFIDNDEARIRLVSLMRVQSIFFSPSMKLNHTVSVVKESGKKRYKYYLTDKEWNEYNNKYAEDSCALTNDSSVILNYPCRKAIVTLKDGKSFSVYYTNQLKPIDPKIEPAFSCVPGLVLQYEYEYKKGVIDYTASKINQNPIDARIFKIPNRGYAVKSYCRGCRTKKAKIVSDEINID